MADPQYKRFSQRNESDYVNDTYGCNLKPCFGNRSAPKFTAPKSRIESGLVNQSSGFVGDHSQLQTAMRFLAEFLQRPSQHDSVTAGGLE